MLKPTSSYLAASIPLFSTSVWAREATTAGERLFISSVISCDDVRARDLVANGVDPTVTTDGRTALHFATSVLCSDSFVSELIGMGVDPNQKDSQDNAPLHGLLVWNP